MPYLATKVLWFVGMVDNTRVNIHKWGPIGDLGLFGVKKLVIDEDSNVNNLES